MADMCSCERAVLCLESRAVSARVTKNFVTILVKHVINAAIGPPFKRHLNSVLLMDRKGPVSVC